MVGTLITLIVSIGVALGTFIALIAILVVLFKSVYWLKEWNSYFTENMDDF